MKHFPNYLMSSQHNDVIQKHKEKVHSHVALNSIEPQHNVSVHNTDHSSITPLTKDTTDTLTTVINAKRSFQQSTVPSLLKGVVRREKVDYDAILKALRLGDEALIVIDDNYVTLENTLQNFSDHIQQTAPAPEVKQNNTVPTPQHKEKKTIFKKGLHQSMASIMSNELTSISYLTNRQ